MGYTNTKRLYAKRICSKSKKIRIFRKTIKLIDIANRMDERLEGMMQKRF